MPPARSRAGTTQAIALVVPEDTTRFFGDPYFAAIVQGITRRLDESEYLLNLLVATNDPGRKTVRYLRRGSSTALSSSRTTRATTRCGEAAGAVPMVFGGRPSHESETEHSTSTSTTSKAA